MDKRTVNGLTGYEIRDIPIWYDAYGLIYNFGKGNYLVVGENKGSS